MKQALTALFIFLFNQANAYDITGKVIKIADGDTATIMTADYSKHKIRLASVDAPEKGQPYGNKSKKLLKRLIAGKNVTAKCTEKDRYKRNVCTIFKGNKDINAAMVSNGGAWVYRKYYKGSAYYKYENEAKAAKRGLWKTSEAKAVPPWKWRHGESNDTNAPQVKLSKSKICHSKGTKYYNRVKRYKGFASINDCLRAGRMHNF